MTRLLPILLIVGVIQVQAGFANGATPGTDVFCTLEWYRFVDSKVETGDGQGHGPDPGSDEWQSVVEFKLGIQGRTGIPPKRSDAWCRFIDQIVRAGQVGSAADGKGSMQARAAIGPSFNCAVVRPGSIEAMVCADAELAGLDRKLATVFAAAAKKATNEHPPVLKAEQRGWIKGRNDCWKENNQRDCVRDQYVRRIAELQARYRLVPFNGPVRYVCDGNPVNEVVASFFKTEPPTLIAERGDATSFMVLQPSASGTRYQGRNETLWEHQGEATITWGYGQPEMRCRQVP